MKLHLIAPARSKKRYLFGKETFPPLGFMYLAAYTPREVEVRIINENLERIDFGELPDLVGITTMTATAARAYEIADRYRELGVKVVLGGMRRSLIAMVSRSITARRPALLTRRSSGGESFSFVVGRIDNGTQRGRKLSWRAVLEGWGRHDAS